MILLIAHKNKCCHLYSVIKFKKYVSIQFYTVPLHAAGAHERLLAKKLFIEMGSESKYKFNVLFYFVCY